MTAAVQAPGKAALRPRPVFVLLAFVAICLVLAAVVGIADSQGSRSAIRWLTGPVWLDGWSQGDSGWYYSIATDGYSYTPGQQSSIAFFPTYPMLVRALGFVIGDDQVAGSLIGVLSGAGAVLLFAVFVRRRLSAPATTLAVAVLMLYPYSFFLYGAMYSDSVFLLAAISAFLLVDRQLYWLAGLVGALATAGRPVGVAVAVGLVVRVLEMRAQTRDSAHTTRSAAERRITAATGGAGSANPGRTEPIDRLSNMPSFADLVRAVPAVRWRDAGVLLAALGLVGWCVYLGVTFGDPLAFVTVQGAPGWYQGGGLHTWFKLNFFGTLIKGPPDVAVRLAAQALMCLLAVLLLRRTWRLFGWGYLSYAVVVLAIPIIGTKDFMGTGRYVMAAFPVLAAAGHFLATRCPRPLQLALLAVSATGLVVATYFYARGVALT